MLSHYRVRLPCKRARENNCKHTHTHNNCCKLFLFVNNMRGSCSILYNHTQNVNPITDTYVTCKCVSVSGGLNFSHWMGTKDPFVSPSNVDKAASLVWITSTRNDVETIEICIISIFYFVRIAQNQNRTLSKMFR